MWDAIHKKSAAFTALFVVPFAAWILLMSALPSGSATMYAVRSAVTLMLLVAGFAIARQYLKIRTEGISSAIIYGVVAGLMVLALWVLPDYCGWYRRWCVWPVGMDPATSTGKSVYDPSVSGWWLTFMRIFGSAFVIAPVEELFFRSFLYRWLQDSALPWYERTTNKFDTKAFMLVTLLFACEHDRFLVAAITGAIYGMLAVRKGLLSAIVAHITTNLALGIFVVTTGNWNFW